MIQTRPVRLLAGAVLAATLFACGGDSTTPSDDDLGKGDTPAPVIIPAVGAVSTLDVATWNLFFFGADGEDPVDDALQRRMVDAVIQGSDLDLWAVQEVVDVDDFRLLLDSLPGYDGILANDPTVENGPAHYSDFDDAELKVGLVYKSDVVEVLEARVVLTGLDYEFAGRPPLELRLRVSVDGTTDDLTVVVLHAKSNTQETSYERRRDAAEGLLNHLTSNWADEPVLVLGDFNDDVDESITAGRDTPYRNFLDAGPDWIFVSAVLTQAGETSILGYDDVIDHILASDETYAGYEMGSAAVLRPDTLITDYRDTTTDHLPVMARFRLGG